MTASRESGSEPVTEPAERTGPWGLGEVVAHVVRGPDVGLCFRVGGRPIVVGSGADSDVRLHDGALSKRHVALAVVGASVHLRDLESTNGTFVGSYRVKDSLVPTGTIVRVGRSSVHLRGEDESIVVEPSEADHFGDLRGASFAMRQLYAVLERVAASDTTVLLDGETGTGKELAARAIHARSARSAGPFLVFDCSAATAPLVEAQLFGHGRGAFTGAVGERRGVLEAAAGGTVFLDELDALPLDLQPKLLRALESRAVVRLGESAERPLDLRVVAASGRSPEQLAAEGLLRRDLYFRLAVVRITMPTLRDRAEDLPLLVDALTRRLGRPIAVDPGRNLDRLRKHGWPGNVRELRNVLEAALTLAPTTAATLDDLPIRLGAPRAAARPELWEQLPYKEAKERLVAGWEAAYLRAAFERNHHNVSSTARELGLSRLHLRRLLSKHGLAS